MKQKVISLLILLGFYLGCHQGQIALWTDHCPNPVQVFPYKVTSLPHADQQLLREGIYVSDDMELAQRLEDYLS